MYLYSIIIASIFMSVDTCIILKYITYLSVVWDKDHFLPSGGEEIMEQLW